MSEQDVQAPGWDAIDSALAPLYGGVKPMHWGTFISHRLGGPDPLDGISAYRREDPIPHWHYVTYGMSELYAKESDDLAFSGWGCEFTFRLAPAEEDGDAAPTWPLALLNHLARYVFDSGNILLPGHHLTLSSAADDLNTTRAAVAFALDPELPPIDTPNGRVEFLQVVGITDDEHLSVRRWSTAAVLELLAEGYPLLVTDPRRISLLRDPAVAARIADGVRRDGSRTGSTATNHLAFSSTDRLLGGKRHILQIGAKAAEEMAAVLPGRLPFGRDYLIIGGDCRVRLMHGEHFGVSRSDDEWLLSLTSANSADLLAALIPKAGRRPVASAKGLEVEVVKSLIRDREGRVVETVG